jgi:BMFP domain-containing protein YqiC
MQTRSPFFDEIAKTMENAMGVAQTMGEEAKAAVRAQADRMAAELDLVRRDEFDAQRALFQSEIATLRSEISGLRSEIADLQTSKAIARPTDDAG